MSTAAREPQRKHAWYRYCGLTIRSELELAELPAAAATGEPDLEVRLAPVAHCLANAVQREVTFEIAPDQALWRLEGVAHFRVAEAGRLIEVEPAPGAAPAAVHLFLLHPVFTLAAMMRGNFMLRAAAVQSHNGVVAFIGMPGIGKSTAAALLASRGYPLVSDSLLRVVARPTGEVLAYPQAPWLLLWPDVREQLEPTVVVKPARPGSSLGRVWLPACELSAPLARIALIGKQRGNDLEMLGQDRQEGRLGFATLLRQTAGNGWLNAIESVDRRHFAWLGGLLDSNGSVALEGLDIPWGSKGWESLAEELAEWAGPPPAG